MRKIVLFITGIILGVVLYIQLENGERVVNSSRFIYDNDYVQNITVVANKVFIIDKEKYAKKLIEKSINNNFDGIKLSYDQGELPSEINICVYTNALSRKRNDKNFMIHCKLNCHLHKDNTEYEIQVLEKGVFE